MYRFLLPIVTVAMLIAAPLVTSRPENTNPRALWLTVYTYDYPERPILGPGKHTYQFTFRWDNPKPGSLIGQVHTFEVADNGTFFPGYALLRPKGIQVANHSDGQVSCEMIDRVLPNQPIRFMVAWVPDNFMTLPQLKDHLASMKATVQWDDHPPVPLVAQRASVSWDALWNCTPWSNKSTPLAYAPGNLFDFGLAGLPLNTPPQ